MEELVKIRKSPVTGNPIVFATDLYNSLGVTKELVHWINAKIRTLSLIEKKDFFLVYYDAIGVRVLETSSRIARVDCIFTITTAKNIALSYKGIRCNAIGQYLLEKELKEILSKPVVETIKAEPNQEFEITEKFHPNLISSMEISKVTEKLHKNVISDIRNMCADGNIIIMAEIPAIIDTEEVMVISGNYTADMGMGRKREFFQYYLNEMAADVLGMGYDVKRRIALVKLVKKMKLALEQRPVQTVMLQAKNVGFNEAGKLFGTNGRGINHTLKKAGYLRPNNKPYEKHVLQGYFAWELYDNRFTNKHLTLTPDKGMPLLQELYNKKVNLPAIIPVIREQAQPQASMLPATQIDPMFVKMLFDTNNMMFNMANYILMVKAGKTNKFEEAKYVEHFKTFNAEYNPEKLKKL